MSVLASCGLHLQFFISRLHSSFILPGPGAYIPCAVRRIQESFMQPPFKNPILVRGGLGEGLSARGMHFQMVMCWFLLGYFAAATQEDTGVSGLCLAQRGKKLSLGTADVPVAGVMACQRLVCGGCSGVARVMPFMAPLVSQMRTDMGVALMCAVGAVSV